MMFQNDKIDITHINDRLYVVGQCWKNRSEKMSERNNAQELKLFLDANFQNKYLLWRFDQTCDDSIFTNAVLFKKPEFSLEMALSIGKSVRGWQYLDPKNICIFECKGNTTKMLFLLSSVLRFCNLFKNSLDAYRHVIDRRYRNGKHDTSTLFQFLNYFDRMLRKDYKSACVLRFKQIIISKIPKMTENGCKPIFKIVKDNNETLLESEKKLVDDNYIVSEFAEVNLSGDTKIQLFHTEEKIKHLVFEICLNTSFMNEGLYRFTVSDIIFPFSDAVVKSKIGTDFLVDIVLLDTNSTEKHVYNTDSSNIDNLRALSQHHKNSADHSDLKSLVNSGYNRVYARVLLQIGHSKQEVIDKITNLNVKEKGLIKKGNSLLKTPEKQIKFENLMQKEDTKSVCELAYNKKPFEPKNYNCGTNITLGELDLIPDKFIFQTDEKKKGTPFKKFLFKNKPENLENEPDTQAIEALVVKNPLYWQALVGVNNTFFQDIEKIKMVYDKAKFEDWFCEPAIHQAKKQDHTSKSVLNDEKRVFLISIAFKTLEKRKINTKDLYDVIYTNGRILDLEDLQNIQRVIPTKIEMDKFEAYQKGENNLITQLNQVEQLFFTCNNNAELHDIVELLIFERRFVDEFETLEKDLSNTKTLYDSISKSNNIRIILKAILDIGNLFNYSYSKSKFRKKAPGFKITSLTNVISHKSNKKDKNLLTYIYLTLVKNNVSAFGVFEELKLLSTVKNDDLVGHKDKINKFILDYMDAKCRLFKLNEEEKIVVHLKQFISFVYVNLKMLSERYREVVFLSGVLKRKFGESDKENISELLTILYNFITRLQEEYNLQMI